VDQGIAIMVQGGPGAGGGGHGLGAGGSGEMAGPRTGVVDHVDQGLLATSNGNRTMKSFLLMHPSTLESLGGGVCRPYIHIFSPSKSFKIFGRISSKN
jgi:hypothetical protein